MSDYNEQYYEVITDADYPIPAERDAIIDRDGHTIKNMGIERAGLKAAIAKLEAENKALQHCHICKPRQAKLELYRYTLQKIADEEETLGWWCAARIAKTALGEES